MKILSAILQLNVRRRLHLNAIFQKQRAFSAHKQKMIASISNRLSPNPVLRNFKLKYLNNSSLLKEEFELQHIIRVDHWIRPATKWSSSLNRNYPSCCRINSRMNSDKRWNPQKNLRRQRLKSHGKRNCGKEHPWEIIMLKSARKEFLHNKHHCLAVSQLKPHHSLFLELKLERQHLERRENSS